MKTYTPTIGIEVHAELKTATKMFCSSKNDPHGGEPNTHVCPICMGHPGTLPVINKEAVKLVLMVGKAVGGKLATFTEFDRKNYFYPDIPKGYQISQYEFPLVSGGVLADVALTRIHLEEDTARSQHDVTDGSVVDFNRAGVPLMELVTEPVIHDAKTAGNFARELQLLLRTLNVSDAHMEQGGMRVEANVSVSSDNSFGTKVEVKNLNSFKAVEGAIEYEIKRQIALIEEGGKVVQETRGWDDTKSKTYTQRVKESAHDYRYFPDPDLPKLSLNVAEFISDLPELPREKRKKYSDLGLTREQVEVVIGSGHIDLFLAAAFGLVGDTKELPRLLTNYLLTDLLPQIGEGETLNVAHAGAFVSLMRMTYEGRINSRVAKDLMKLVVLEGQDPVKLVTEAGLEQTQDADELRTIAETILADHPMVVDEYKQGKEPALQFLVGQGMRLTKGKANPTVLAETLKSIILQK